MSIEFITLLLFGALIVCLITGVPLAFCLGGVAAAFFYFLFGADELMFVVFNTFGIIWNTAFITIPLFVFMGVVLERAGIADNLFDMMYRWSGPLKGGLAMGTVVICAIFAAMTGVTGAACVTMGLIALPAMIKRGYDKHLALGSVAGPSTLGILIPPSIIMILFAVIGHVSMGKLFMAGIGPGILIAFLFIVYIFMKGLVQPTSCPALSERSTLGQKIAASRAIILPGLIIISVLGSIFLGIATPTEASAVGAFGCIVAAGVQRRLTWQLVRESAYETFRINALCMWVCFGAVTFSALYARTGGIDFAEKMLLGLGLGRWGTLIVIQVLIFFLGCFLDNFAIILLVAPISVPIIEALGFDPIWFGILFVINTQMGYLTPPFGYNLFYLKAIVPRDISMIDIYRSVIPSLVVLTIGMALVMIFPKIALWLPKMMIKPGG